MPDEDAFKYRNPPNPPLTKEGEEGLIPQSTIPNLKSRGFTLIEIIIVIVIIGIISGIAALIILQGVRSYSDEQSRSDVHYQARLAMERMTREIRLIRSTADIIAMTPANLRFTDMTGSNVGFTWVNPNLNRWNGVGTDLLTANATAFAFSYFQQDGITVAVAPANVWYIDIDMTAQQGSETLQMRTRVHPRNF